MQGFAFTRSPSWLYQFWPRLTAMKGTNSAEGDPPVCKRPLLAEYTLQHYAERSKNPHQNRLSLPETPALSRTGGLMLWVSLSLILFLSCFCRQQQSWLVWWPLQTTHPSYSHDDPKASPKIRPNSLPHVRSLFNLLFCAHKHRAQSLCHNPSALQAFASQTGVIFSSQSVFTQCLNIPTCFVGLTVPPATHFRSNTSSHLSS